MRSNTFFSVAAVALFILLFSGCSLQTSSSGGGIYKSSDGGATFEQKNFISEKASIANANILSLAVDPADSNTIYIGTATSGLLRSSDGGNKWIKSRDDFTNVHDIIINPNNNQEIYIATDVASRGKVLRTTNGGEKWTELFTGRTDVPQTWSIAMDKNNPAIIYAGDSAGGIYKSINSGETWKTLKWAKSGIKEIIIDSKNSSKIYFVTAQTGVLRSDDGGENLQDVISQGTVFKLVAHPYKEGYIFLSDKKGLQFSSDSGETFEVINTLVQPEEMISQGIAVDPENDQVIFFASGKAFYKSTDGGKTWKAAQLNVSRSIEVIKIDPKNHDVIYFGVNGKNSSSEFKLFPF